MPSYRRRLPHIYETGHSVFLTWRLHDSLPPNRAFPSDSLTSGRAFVTMDGLLDEAHSGPFYLRQPAVALPILTKSLKGITAKRANRMLALTGGPFWQEESYDHMVRHAREFEKILATLRTILCERHASDYRWSSAVDSKYLPTPFLP
jgi:putative transposase